MLTEHLLSKAWGQSRMCFGGYRKTLGTGWGHRCCIPYLVIKKKKQNKTADSLIVCVLESVKYVYVKTLLLRQCHQKVLASK